MKFSVLLVLVVCMSVATNVGNAQTTSDFKTIPKKFAAKSPAGGTANHGKAGVLIMYRKSNKLAWVDANGKLQSLALQPTTERDDKKFGGPTPLGEYLIGQRFTNKGTDWYRLYLKKEDSTGYYPYSKNSPNKNGRSTFGLHPGTLSLGCITVHAADAVATEN